MEKPETPEPVLGPEVEVDPEPEEGDFYDDLPLDKEKDADGEDSNPEGDDNDVAEELREKK